MPICKNDSSKTYKGDEPSPKGLGYCAHAEKLKTEMEGKDGKRWIVSKNKNNTKKWIPYKPKLITRNYDKLTIAQLRDNIDILLKKNKLPIQSNEAKAYFYTAKALRERDEKTFNAAMDKVYETMLARKPHAQHSITIKDKIFIGDPFDTYDRGLKYKAKSGKWNVSIYSFFDNPRPNFVVAEIGEDEPDRIEVSNISVDSSTAIIIAEENFPRFEKFSNDQIDWALKFDTGRKMYKAFKDGIVMISGRGDGEYSVGLGYYKDKIVWIQIEFMYS